MENLKEKLIDITILLLKVLLYIYDIITFPIYYYIQKPYENLEANKKIRSWPVSNDPGGPYRHINSFKPLQLQIMSHINTFYDIFKQLIPLYGNNVCLGTREVLAEEDEVQPNGRIFKKLVMGNYQWETFNEVLIRVNNFSRGIKSLGVSHKENIVLFAETRAEWIIAALACFRHNIPVVTLYANLGEDALIHGINETEASIIITSHELLGKFKTLLEKTPSIKHVIYMEGFHKQNLKDYASHVQISTFANIEDIGSVNNNDDDLPTISRSDPAVIMYTSGSTGLPKGVIMSHGNLIATLTSFSSVITIYDDDIYLGYLPLAHILELSCEFVCLLNGVPVGYSSPQTISDKSSKVKKGTKGDAGILQPTFIPAVPLILDRIYKNVLEVVKDGGRFNREFFNFAYDYKLQALRNGYSTPILDLLVFKKIRNLLGGNVRLMVTGGAPLSPDTHDFIRVCLCCPLLQGYGLTETSACATVMDPYDLSTSRVGSPMICCDIELVDWEEGNYLTTDKPYPRGEIIIGGENVALGYYKHPEKTQEDFFEKFGKRWFRTGDIGEIHEDGCFKIIDRKKDLVKLQFGEYVSLGKVEAELKMLQLVENVCVYADSTKLYSVALITPNLKKLEQFGHELGKNGMSAKELCMDKDVEQAVTKMIQNLGKTGKLEKFEIPQKVRLIPDSWLPDSGLVTAAYKLKRKHIQEKYQSDIDDMYSSVDN